MMPRVYYVEYTANMGQGPARYRQGPWDLARARMERDDIEGFTGITGATVVHHDQLDPLALQLG